MNTTPDKEALAAAQEIFGKGYLPTGERLHQAAESITRHYAPVRKELDRWRECAEKLAAACELVAHGTPGMGEAIEEFERLSAAK